MVRRPLLRLLAVVLLGALVLPACSKGSIQLEAEFEDVFDLVEQAKVMTADLPIGTVTGIELTDENTAKVTMSVRDDTGLPSEVKAVVRQTSLLGERYIELVPLNENGSLSSGSIQETEIVSDLEDLVNTGNDLLAFVAADRLSRAVQAGAITFGGQAAELQSLLTDLEQFVGTYDQDKGEVLRLLDNLEQLLGTLASEAEVHGEALEALARSTQALKEEDERLIDALSDLRRLGVVGRRILADNRQEFHQFFSQLRTILDALTAIEGGLEGVLTYLPRHNLHVPNGQLNEFVQLWTDLIICGTDDERQGDPTRDCTPPDPVRTRGTHAVPADECDTRHEGCDYPEGVDPDTTNDQDETDDRSGTGEDDTSTEDDFTEPGAASRGASR